MRGHNVFMGNDGKFFQNCHEHHLSWRSEHPCTVELQWLEQSRNHENMFEKGEARANGVNHSTRSGGIIGIAFRFSLT